MKLSRRVSTASPSATIAMATRTHALRAAGVDVVSLVAGEPDLPVPAHAIAATTAALDRGETRYPPLAGIPALRTAAAAMLTRCHQVEIAAPDVVVTVGGKLAIYNALQALVDEGDEVLVLAPHWVSYPAQVQLAGGIPVLVHLDADSGFTLDDAALARVAAAITPRTVGLILNSPNNPTGAVYSAASLGALGDLAAKRDLWIISDDIYSELTYDDAVFSSVLRERPQLADRVILVHGVAKSYAMTGYRIGFLAGPPAVVAAALLLQGQETSGATTFAQHGALAALTGDQAFLDSWRATYDTRRVLMHRLLNAIDGVSCPLPTGAFYCFADVRPVLGGAFDGIVIRDDVQLCTQLIEHAHVAVVPGSAFGAPGFIRLAYTSDTATIERGIARIASFVDGIA